MFIIIVFTCRIENINHNPTNYNSNNNGHYRNGHDNNPSYNSYTNNSTTNSNNNNNHVSLTNSYQTVQTTVFKAIYDYDAKEDDEISFRDGDKFINCEQIDVGWMIGKL